MKEEIIRKKICTTSDHKREAASDLKGSAGGDYFCDYSPRYQEKYSIYDKAKKHAKMQKQKSIKKLKKVVDNEKPLW